MMVAAGTARPSTGRPVEILEAVLASSLMRRGGFAVMEGLLGELLVGQLAQEASERRAEARRSEYAGPASHMERGNDPARAYWSATGGPLQHAVFGGVRMQAVVSEVCGVPVRITGGGTYSYYDGPGDFLALHRDIVTCDVAVISCLEETEAVAAPAGTLRLYPRHAQAPLADVRPVLETEGLNVPLPVGRTVVMFGGIVPHEVTRMAEGQRRVVSVLCFRVEG